MDELLALAAKWEAEAEDRELCIVIACTDEYRNKWVREAETLRGCATEVRAMVEATKARAA